MSGDILDDFDLDNNALPPQSSPKPIEGKPKRNIQRWLFLFVLAVALPIAIWQGMKEERTNVEEWKVKEQERKAVQARGNQAGGESVKEISLLADQQKLQAEQTAASAPSSTTTFADGPMPVPPTGKPEELPIVPGSSNVRTPTGAKGSGADFDSQRATSSILVLSGSDSRTRASAADIAANGPIGAAPITPEMFMSKTPQPNPNSVASNLVAAMKDAQPKAPSTRAEAAEQWMKAQQQSVSNDSAGIYARPAHGDTVIMEGTMIDAALLTAVNTDLPGEATAIITRDVYDSMEPERYMLIPKGTKLLGSYNSGVNVGQERIMMAFKRMIFPNGSSVNLMGMQGTDAMGRAGMEGDVNNHFAKMFGASFLIAGLSKIMEPKQPVNVNVFGTGGGNLTTEAGVILTDISSRVLRRNEDIPPTITLPAGQRFNVRVNKDMHLPPYQFH